MWKYLTCLQDSLQKMLKPSLGVKTKKFFSEMLKPTLWEK